MTDRRHGYVLSSSSSEPRKLMCWIQQPIRRPIPLGSCGISEPGDQCNVLGMGSGADVFLNLSQGCEISYSSLSLVYGNDPNMVILEPTDGLTST